MLTAIQLLCVRISALRNEKGASGVEYGLLIALIAAVIVTTVATLGTTIDAAFQRLLALFPGG